MTIRPARADDFATIQEIEVEAGARFASVGMDLVAEDEPFSIDELAGFADEGRAWIAPDLDGRAVGYLVAGLVDGRVHLAQVSVRPSHGRRGIGRALVEHVASWTADQGFSAITLTTFATIPWNGPRYENFAFRRLADAELTPGLRAIRTRDAEHGLDRWPRLATLRAVAAHRSPA